MSLKELVLESGCRRLSIIGMAKNTGKTTTLVTLSEELAVEGYRLGFLSLGRDGEDRDLVTSKEKPRINVPRGSLVATAEELESETDAALMPLHTTDILTPFGPVVLYRALTEGQVILAGTRTGVQLSQLMELMEDECDLILIDGALNRRRSATPSLSEATILCTGAAVGHSLSTILQKTRDALDLFSLPELEDELLAEEMKAQKNVEGIHFLFKTGEWENYRDFYFSRGLKQIMPAIGSDLKAIFLPGALTEKRLTTIIESMDDETNFFLVVPDATHLFVSPKQINSFISRGGKLRVLDRIRILALTINPYSPSGPSYRADIFYQAFLRVIGDLPLFDLKADLSSWKHQNNLREMV